MKPAASSKTIWINALNVIATVAVYWQAPEAFTPEVAALWLTGAGVGNLILRKLTTAGIKFS